MKPRNFIVPCLVGGFKPLEQYDRVRGFNHSQVKVKNKNVRNRLAVFYSKCAVHKRR